MRINRTDGIHRPIVTIQKFAEANSMFGQFYAEIDFERQDKHAREEDSLDMFKTKARGERQGVQ